MSPFWICCLYGVVGWKKTKNKKRSPLTDFNVLIPEASKCDLTAKTKGSLQMGLSILRWEDYAGLSWVGPTCNHMHHHKEGDSSNRRGEGHTATKAETGWQWPKTKECGQAPEARRLKVRLRPRASGGSRHLDFSPVRLISTSWPPILQRINFCYLNHQVCGYLLQSSQETDTMCKAYIWESRLSLRYDVKRKSYMEKKTKKKDLTEYIHVYQEKPKKKKRKLLMHSWL